MGTSPRPDRRLRSALERHTARRGQFQRSGQFPRVRSRAQTGPEHPHPRGRPVSHTSGPPRGPAAFACLHAMRRRASRRLRASPRAIDLDVTGAIVAPLSQIRPASYLGAGKVDEIAARVKEEDVGLVMVDCALSPVQQRNLEKAFGAKVIDRTGLILEIFGRRARTARARCRSNSPISTTRSPASCGHGPIWSASAAASAFSAAPAKPRSRPTAASSRSA